MRILHIAHYDRFPRSNETFVGNVQNGLERFLESLIINDVVNEHFVMFFNDYDYSILVEHILPNGQTATYVSYLDVKFDQMSLERVFAELFSFLNFSLIHIHYMKPFVRIVPTILERYAIPMLATMHDESYLGSEYGRDQKYFYDDLVANFFQRLDKVVFAHKIIQERYEAMFDIRSKTVVIPMGTNLRPLAKINDDQNYRVAIIGSLNNDKGLNLVREVASQVSESVQITHVGNYEYPIDNVRHFGPYENAKLGKILSAFAPDIVLIPSLVEESFSYAALEASALGYPIITLDYGALADIANEGRGIVIKRDKRQQLATTINQLAVEKVTDHRAYCQHFANVSDCIITEQQMVAEYTNIYQQIANHGELFFHEQAIAHHNLTNYKAREQKLFEQALIAQTPVEPPEGNNMIKRIKRAITKRGGIVETTKKASKAFQRDGFNGTYYRFRDKSRYDIFLYEKWLQKNEITYTNQEVQQQLQELKYQPKISILIPVYNVDEIYLRACIDSIIAQQYPNWELCIADDCSTKPHVRPVLEQYMSQDDRIRVVFREQNGHISLATNSALEIATGEFIALVDNDDTIKENALLEVVKKMNSVERVDMIYTDEDKIDASGKHRLAPFFKPDWSPDAFWCHMYLCHLGVYRTEIARQIGGFRQGYEGAQDYDFALRFTEKTDHIHHIPIILYHWRMIPTSTAANSDNKDYAYLASLRAKESAIARRNLPGVVEAYDSQLSTNVYFMPSEGDLISIIIPTRDHGDDVKKCIESIVNVSTWKNYEIILVDNGTTDQHSLDVFDHLLNKYSNMLIIDAPGEFNYSALNNKAVKHARGNMLLFLNNDTEVITPDWLERLSGQAKLAQTGAVGARLFYANDHVQHAGIISLNDAPVHAFHNFVRWDLGYFGRLSLTYNYLAVTGACLMVERTKFEEVGGFDEVDLPISYNDVDFCLKLYDRGYFNVVRGDVDLYHYESQSRGIDEQDSAKLQRMELEKQLLNERWYKYLHVDPFYNVNLTHEKVDFTLK